jgi:hypothetical protein
MNKYILYCAQDANFQTRSMLIPYDKYLLCDDLVKNFDVLRKHSKEQTFIIAGVNYKIDNLLLQNIMWNDNCGQAESTEYNIIIDRLTQYADGLDDGQYFSINDKVWYDSTINNLCGGFNHIKNYCSLRNSQSYETKPIQIVEGFLVLQTRDGVLKMPNVDTVKELYEKYY